MATDNQEERPLETQPDPLADSSLSGPILLGAVLLFLSLGWALYDEVFAERPWKRHQAQFARLYSTFLKKLGPRQAANEKSVRSSAEFQKIETQLKAAEQQTSARVREIDSELSVVRQQLAAIKDPFQDVRAKVAALTYDLDHAGSARAKDGIRSEIRKVKEGPFRIIETGSKQRALDLTFDDLEKRFIGLKGQESRLNAELAQLTAPVRELRRQRNEYLTENVAGLSPEQIEALLRANQNQSVEIRQIHVEEAGLIDRCESCHMGIRQPVAITAADMGGRKEFVSHPNKALLAIHDPTRFGCSPCHNGNGLATSSVEKAHGRYAHWLWPLYPKENSEAGCLQCHFNDRVLDHAPVLGRGRDLYELKGCVGCHRYEGFDGPNEQLSEVRKEVQGLESRQKEARLDALQETKKGDEAQSNEQAQRHYARVESLKLTISTIDARLEALDQRSKYLMLDQKKIGPNLKDVRLKLRKEWLPVWLKDPQAFRPGTKMPTFRLSNEEIRALSAFIWQAGLDGPRPAPQPSGNAAAGKELFETRGCLACHSIGRPGMGGEFAANLTRLGEKADFAYIVRWIHNPRERTRPYCPHEKRDLGPEDYSRHGLPFVYDVQNSKCPNDGHELQVQNLTVMPSFRLTVEEARDIATYLTGLKQNASYPSDVAYMDDSQLAVRGRQLVARYGCGSCHEIGGFEDAPRIGTELTKEASKPMEQLDFGLLEHKAKAEGWYSHAGFFENKMQTPSIYDQGREKAPEDRLRMPNIALTKEDIRALNTFLLGSVDSPFYGKFNAIPEQFRYMPTDRRKEIQAGWWLVKKYNCMGCHPVQIGQNSVLSTLPRYQDPDWKEQLPPTLIQEGARVNPQWLARFLANPAMTGKDENRNGIRTYLKARMPTFHFSPNEIRVLVRFFEALSGQPAPYMPEELKPLDNQERSLARALFTSEGAPCLKCHLVGDAGRDRFATAPNFLVVSERLKPAWTARWMLDPQSISPGTAMPSGLFRHEAGRWVFAGPTPPSFKDYKGDHVQLLVRYMFELTAAEQRQLLQKLPAQSAPKAATTAMR